MEVSWKTRRWHDPKLIELATIPFFRSCSPAQLALLGRLAEKSSVPPGAPLQVEGSPVRVWCVLQRGSAGTSRYGQPRALFGPGDFWGEVPLLTRTPARESVIALTEGTVFSFDRRSFVSMLVDVPGVALPLLEALAAPAAGAPYQSAPTVRAG